MLRAGPMKRDPSTPERSIETIQLVERIERVAEPAEVGERQRPRPAGVERCERVRTRRAAQCVLDVGERLCRPSGMEQRVGVPDVGDLPRLRRSSLGLDVPVERTSEIAGTVTHPGRQHQATAAGGGVAGNRDPLLGERPGQVVVAPVVRNPPGHLERGAPAPASRAIAASALAPARSRRDMRMRALATNVAGSASRAKASDSKSSAVSRS